MNARSAGLAAVMLVAVAAPLPVSGCVEARQEGPAARSYQQRTDVPPRDIGPAADTGAPPRDMQGRGRGTAPNKGK